MASHSPPSKDTGKSISDRGKEVGKGMERKGNWRSPSWKADPALGAAPTHPTCPCCARVFVRNASQYLPNIYRVSGPGGTNRIRTHACSSHNYCQTLKSIVQGAHVDNPCAVNGQMGTSCSSRPRHWIVLGTPPQHTHRLLLDRGSNASHWLLLPQGGRKDPARLGQPAREAHQPSQDSNPIHHFAVSFSLPTLLGAPPWALG